MSELTTHLLIIYTWVAVLIAFGLQSAMQEKDREDRLQVLVATAICALWPLAPALVALMKWDLRRMKENK